MFVHVRHCSKAASASRGRARQQQSSATEVRSTATSAARASCRAARCRLDWPRCASHCARSYLRWRAGGVSEILIKSRHRALSAATSIAPPSFPASLRKKPNSSHASAKSGERLTATSSHIETSSTGVRNFRKATAGGPRSTNHRGHSRSRMPCPDRIKAASGHRRQ
jgi:hypothetical protein